jgi:hypothetical protein
LYLITVANGSELLVIHIELELGSDGFAYITDPKTSDLSTTWLSRRLQQRQNPVLVDG